MGKSTNFTPGPLHGQTVLVTGGSGFLGVHVAQELARQGARLVLQDSSLRRPDLLAPVMGPGQAYCVVCDLQAIDRAPALLSQLPEVDYLVYLGFHVPATRNASAGRAEYQAQNLEALGRLLPHLPARLKGVCLASSLRVYGDNHPTPIAETEPANPQNAYAAARLALENALLEFGQRRSLPVSVLRYAMLFGPGELYSARPIPSFIRNVLVGQPPVLYGDGSDIRDYLYVKDAARAMALALANVSRAPGIYNIGAGHGWTTRAVAETIQRLLHSSVQPKHMPARGPHQCTVADIALAQQCLGFAPQVQLEEGLAVEIDYHRAHMLSAAETGWFDPEALWASALRQQLDQGGAAIK